MVFYLKVMGAEGEAAASDNVRANIKETQKQGLDSVAS